MARLSQWTMVVLLALTIGGGFVVARAVLGAVNDPLGTGLALTLDSLKSFFPLLAALIAGEVALLNQIISRRAQIELEFIKLNLESIKELNRSALTYVDTLSRLETGVFDLNELNACEEAMRKNFGLVHIMPQSYQEHWYSTWQESRRLKELATQKLENANGEQRRNFWKEEGADLRHRSAELVRGLPIAI